MLSKTILQDAMNEQIKNELYSLTCFTAARPLRNQALKVRLLVSRLRHRAKSVSY